MRLIDKEGSSHNTQPLLHSAAAPSLGAARSPPTAGDPAPGPTFLSNSLPATYRTVRACALGSFFIMSQNVTELFAVYDGHSAERDAVKLSWHSLTMRVTTALRGTHVALRSFDLVRAKLLEPRPLLDAIVENVYAEALPHVDP